MSTTLTIDASRPEPPEERGRETFRVAVFAHIDDPTEVTDVLTTIAGLHPDDAMRAAHWRRGFFQCD